jgi:FMN-binding domain
MISPSRPAARRRALLGLLAVVAGLVIIFTVRAMTMEPGSPPTAIVSPSESPSPPTPVDLTGLQPDGGIAGDVVEIPGGHGPLQVRLTVSDGELVEAGAVHDPTTAEAAQTSAEAIEVLREAVLTSQQAPVDVVSGATATSDAFNESLLSIVS